MVNCNLINSIISLIVCLLAVNFMIFFPLLIDSKLNDQLVLKPEVTLLEKWSNIKLPIYVKIYFFNVLNANDVEFNGQKVILKEIGPYTFLEKRNKNIFQFLDGGKNVVFNERRRYYFQSDQSIGTLQDVITLPNIPKLVMASKAINDDSEDAGLFYDVIDAMFKKLDPPMFENYTVDEILFKGYKVEIFEEMKTMLKGFSMPVPKEIDDGEFGLFYKKNGSVDLIWEVGTGLKNEDLFSVKSYNRSKSLNFWKTEECNQIRGTEGSGFHKHLNKKDKLFIFDPNMCKSAELVFKKESANRNVKSYRFVLSDKVFASIEDRPENDCFCTRPLKARDICSRAGVFDLSRCANGAPLVLSNPHFLNADLDLIQKIEDGINANEKNHETYVDIEPLTGSVIAAKKRVQFNIEIFQNKSLEGFANVQPMVLPIAWMEESFELDEEMANDLITLERTIFYGKLIPMLLIVIMTLLFAFSLNSFLKRKGKVNITTK